MKLNEIMREFRQKLARQVGSESNVREFDPGEDGRFVFSQAIKDKVVEAASAAVDHVMDKIVSRHPPRRRRGDGSHDVPDEQSLPGAPFNLP